MRSINELLRVRGNLSEEEIFRLGDELAHQLIAAGKLSAVSGPRPKAALFDRESLGWGIMPFLGGSIGPVAEEAVAVEMPAAM